MSKRSPHSDLYALRDRLYAAVDSLVEQFEAGAVNLHNARELLKQALDEEHSIRELKISADAALEAMGERLECVTAERNDLRERLEKLARWYGHDLGAALGTAAESTK